MGDGRPDADGGRHPPSAGGVSRGLRPGVGVAAGSQSHPAILSNRSMSTWHARCSASSSRTRSTCRIITERPTLSADPGQKRRPLPVVPEQPMHIGRLDAPIGRNRAIQAAIGEAQHRPSGVPPSGPPDMHLKAAKRYTPEPNAGSFDFNAASSRPSGLSPRQGAQVRQRCRAGPSMPSGSAIVCPSI